MSRDYAMTTPCADCPFRSDIPPFLRADRAQGIADTLLQGGSFSCHKTIDYEDDGDDGESRANDADASFCAGALIVTIMTSGPNNLMRVAMRLGLFDPSKLDLRAPTYRNLKAFVKAQEKLPKKARKR